MSIADAMRHGGVDRIEQESATDFAEDSSHARNTHSAIFAEVKVDEELGVIRVTRIVSAVAAGRILNAKTARSQIMGGVVWGIGMALHEETLDRSRFRPRHECEHRRVPRAGECRRARHRRDLRRRARRDHQSARHQGRRRDRHRRRRGGDRQRGLSRHRQARARPADHAGQAAWGEVCYFPARCSACDGATICRFVPRHPPCRLGRMRRYVRFTPPRAPGLLPALRPRRRRCPWRRPRTSPAGAPPASRTAPGS